MLLLSIFPNIWISVVRVTRWAIYGLNPDAKACPDYLIDSAKHTHTSAPYRDTLLVEGTTTSTWRHYIYRVSLPTCDQKLKVQAIASQPGSKEEPPSDVTWWQPCTTGQHKYSSDGTQLVGSPWLLQSNRILEECLSRWRTTNCVWSCVWSCSSYVLTYTSNPHINERAYMYRPIYIILYLNSQILRKNDHGYFTPWSEIPVIGCSMKVLPSVTYRQVDGAGGDARWIAGAARAAPCRILTYIHIPNFRAVMNECCRCPEWVQSYGKTPCTENWCPWWDMILLCSSSTVWAQQQAQFLNIRSGQQSGSNWEW